MTSAEEVVRFLEENPGFFFDHPDLLRSSGLLTKDSASAKVLSLRDRLFERLKGEREDLIHILDETIDIVRRNELIERDFLAIENLLFQAPPSTPNLARVAEEIERRFALDHASFLLLGSLDGIPQPAGRVRKAGGEEKTHLPLGGGVLLRGDLAEGAGPLFPAAARGELRSTAVVPLRTEEELLGLLLLGSREPGRYAPNMATHLLERLAMRLALGLSLLRRFAQPLSRRGARRKRGRRKASG